MTNIVLLKNKTVPKDPYHDIFSSNGFETSFVPLLDHIHADMSFITDYLTSDEFYHETPTLIITSQRAVEALSSALSLLTTGQRSNINKKKAYTVGPATHKILQALGFTNLGGGGLAGNGDILSDIILKEVSASEKITFFTGETRRDIIPKKLLANGYVLKEVVIYKTAEKPDIYDRFRKAFDQTTGSTAQWIIFFSPQGTSKIVEYIKTLSLPESLKIASIGPTTETYLLENGITPNLVAAKPEPNSLFSGINSH